VRERSKMFLLGMQCVGSRVAVAGGGRFVLIYYIFPFFSLGGGGGSSFLSFPFVFSVCGNEGACLPRNFEKGKSKSKKRNWRFIKLEAGWS